MTVLLAGVMAAGCTSMGGWEGGHAKDFRTFHATGEIDYGRIRDSYTADLVMYVDGNQFLVMKELIQDFQKANPFVSAVYVETISPGEILNEHILSQGEAIGEPTNQFPDLFASTNIQHLQSLKAEGRMDNHMIYARNKLELMVAKGNPKNIQGPQDLARDDLVQCHPNPITESIFKLYAAEMLKELGIYDKVTGGAKCKRCWAVPDKTWFAEHHYRETPQRIEEGQADVGIVWASEVIEAKSRGRQVDGVAIPEPYNKADKAIYAIGILKDAKNQANAELYLNYLRTRRAQEIYRKYGFVGATVEELESQPL